VEAFAPGVCSAHWRVAAIESFEEAQPHPGAVHAARARYVEADNLGCLEALPAEIETDLFAARRREEAAAASTLRAACAFGAGRTDEARRLVEIALARDAIATADLRGTTPEFQELVEAARAALPRAVPIRVQTSPREVTVEIDGTERCRQATCAFALTPGSHVFVAWGLGLERRVFVENVGAREGEVGIEIALESSSPTEAAADLRRAMSLELAPDALGIARAIRLAFGTDLFVVTRARGEHTAVAIYGTTPGVRGATAMTLGESESLAARVAARCSASAEDADDDAVSVPLWIAIGVGAALAIALAIVLPIALTPDPTGTIRTTP
jgi:hypothetical protein